MLHAFVLMLNAFEGLELDGLRRLVKVNLVLQELTGASKASTNTKRTDLNLHLDHTDWSAL